MKQWQLYLVKMPLAGAILLSVILLNAQEPQYGRDPLVFFPGAKATVYDHLNTISSQLGFMFIYDSQIVDNDKVVKVRKGTYTLSEAVKMISGNKNLSVKIIDNHILLYIDQERDVAVTPSAVKPSVDSLFVIEGRLTDRITKEAVVYGSITTSNYPYGIISNLNGEFRLALPDSLRSSAVKFSHIGYISREIPASLLEGRHVEVFLDQKIVPLQEVVVRIVDPLAAIREMMARRDDNYPQEPVYITAYYREGAECRNNLSLTEAVLKIYKTGYTSSVNSDQVKMLKMRNIINRYEGDTLVAKIKSSISSCLQLDIVKNPPDFLMQSRQQDYNFRFAGITVMDGKNLYQFSFDQRENIEEPLFRGDIYIDMDNYALVKARFEIHPDYVAEVADQVIIKRSRKLDIVPEYIGYEITYKNIDGLYYQDHIRGDLKFKVRRKGKLFSSNLSLWFQMVNCLTDTAGVTRFTAGERLSTREIFSDIKYTYDPEFWGNFNVILPEKELLDLLGKYNYSK